MFEATLPCTYWSSLLVEGYLLVQSVSGGLLADEDPMQSLCFKLQTFVSGHESREIVATWDIHHLCNLAMAPLSI